MVAASLLAAHSVLDAGVYETGTMITSFFKPKSKTQPRRASPGTESSQGTSNSTDGSAATNKKRSLDNEDDTPTDECHPYCTSSTNVGFDVARGARPGAPRGSKRTKSEEASQKLSLSSKNGRAVRTMSKAVSELLEHLEGHGGGEEEEDAGVDGRPGLPRTWRSALWHKFSTLPELSSLAEFVAAERTSQLVHPSPTDTWTALNACPLETVMVVIVGQDPYHGPNQAHGLAFSVERGQAIPPSLRNIYKELRDDPAVPEFNSAPTHGNLLRWARQGVLLLNTVLTVRSGRPNSHAKRGWEAVTDDILRRASTRKTPVVFLLWGKPAAAKAQFIPPSHQAARMQHTIICTSHPSPLGATKTSSPFLGSRCFSRCNDALLQMGLDPIDWRVDGPL